MPPQETLRIRTPPPDNEEDSDEQLKKTADLKSRNIPTIIFGITLTNLAIYAYNTDVMNLYMAAVCGVIWIGFCMDAVYDRAAQRRLMHMTPEFNSGV